MSALRGDIVMLRDAAKRQLKVSFATAVLGVAFTAALVGVLTNWVAGALAGAGIWAILYPLSTPRGSTTSHPNFRSNPSIPRERPALSGDPNTTSGAAVRGLEQRRKPSDDAASGRYLVLSIICGVVAAALYFAATAIF